MTQASNTATLVQRTPRVSAIDTAKGIGITLVVIGHMVARDLKPQGNEWWMVFHEHLYSFHMAFFFFLSGYVFFLKPLEQWPTTLRKSANKLIPAYIVFAMIVYLAKAVAVHLFHVDRPVKDPIDELVLMLTYPVGGYAQFLWFIVTLMMIYVVIVAFRVWISNHVGVALLIFFSLHLLSINGNVTEVFALHQLARYAFFFLLGLVCCRYPVIWNLIAFRYGVVFIVIFLFVLVFSSEVFLPTIAAILSIPALMSLAFLFEKLKSLRIIFQFLGRNTLTIYLMSSLTMGLVRGIVLKLWGWDGWHFIVVAPLLIAAGLLLPVLAQRCIFAHWTWTDRITR